MMRSNNYYLNVLPKLSVTFRLGQEFTGKDYDSFDEVIVATGATNAIIPVPGKDLPIVTSAWDILAKKEIVFGNVSVIGGGLVGVETADYLAARGCNVTIIEMMDQIGRDLDPVTKSQTKEMMEKHHVTQMTSTKLKEVHEDYFIVEKDGKESKIPFDYGFICLGMKAYNPLYKLSYLDR